MIGDAVKFQLKKGSLSIVWRTLGKTGIVEDEDIPAVNVMAWWHMRCCCCCFTRSLHLPRVLFSHTMSKDPLESTTMTHWEAESGKAWQRKSVPNEETYDAKPITALEH